MKTIVLIDNGHGSDTPGKCSPDALKGLTDSKYWFKEYEWCREVAQRACDVLQARGIDARLLVPETNDIPLSLRVKRINAICDQYGKDNVILVSVHNNAAGDKGKWMSARGWSIYTTKGVTESDRLAKYIFDVASLEFHPPLKVRSYLSGENDRDFEENFYILRYSKCPAVLIEHFFQDNKEDVAYLKSIQGKGSCIFVIAKGVEDYLASKV